MRRKAFQIAGFVAAIVDGLSIAFQVLGKVVGNGTLFIGSNHSIWSVH